MTRNWFERLLIVAQKLKAGVRPPKFPKGPTTVGLSYHRWTWEIEGLPELNEGAPWTLKSQGSREKRNTCCYDLTQQNQIMREIRKENQNPPFLPRSRKARFWGAIVWANFALCSNCGQGRTQPNIQSEGKRVSEDSQPRNGQNCHPRRGGACLWGIGPCPRTKVTSGLLFEVSGELVNHSEQRLGQIL